MISPRNTPSGVHVPDRDGREREAALIPKSAGSVNDDQ